MTSALFYSAVCRGNSITANDWNRNNKFIKKAGPIIAQTPDSLEKVLEERTRRKVQTILQFEGHLFCVFFSSSSGGSSSGTHND